MKPANNTMAILFSGFASVLAIVSFNGCGAGDSGLSAGDSGPTVDDTSLKRPDAGTDGGTQLIPDAGTMAADAGTTVVDAGTSSPPQGVLDVVFILHLEGRDCGSASDCAGYISQIRTLMSTWEAYGAKLSLETESVVTGTKESLVQGIQQFGDNVLTEAVSRGHGVELHGGGRMGLESTMSAFEADLTSQGALLQAIGINPVSVSNICSALDWTTAAFNTGYLFTTSIVEYCAKSLPIEKQSASTIACTAPNLCHGPYPTDVNQRLRPWRASGPDWVTSDPNGGLVIIPSTYNLGCISEEISAPGSYLGCTINDADVTAYTSVLDSAVAMATPGVITAFTVVSSFGGHPTTAELTYVRQMLQAVKAYVDQGKARFSTTKEVYNAFVALE